MDVNPVGMQPDAPYPNAKMKPETEPNVETKSGRRPDASCPNAKMWPGIELNVATKPSIITCIEDHPNFSARDKSGLSARDNKIYGKKINGVKR